MQDYIPQQEETWNMALAYLMKLDYLMTLCDKAQIQDNLILWYKALNRLYTKIYPKLKRPEQEEAKRLLGLVLQAKTEGVLNPKRKISHKPFMDLELYLMQMLENRKMLTPKGGDPRFAMA